MFIWLVGSVYQVNFFQTATQVHKGKTCIKKPCIFLKGNFEVNFISAVDSPSYFLKFPNS